MSTPAAPCMVQLPRLPTPPPDQLPFFPAASGAESRGASSHSQRSEQEHEGCCSPDAPGSPRGVGSLAASTAASTMVCSSSGGGTAHHGDASAPTASLLPAPSLSSTGSSHLDGSAATPLLVTVGHGLRHFRVPQHLHWPDALGPRALAVYVTPAAHQASCTALCWSPMLWLPVGVACHRLRHLPPSRPSCPTRQTWTYIARCHALRC